MAPNYNLTPMERATQLLTSEFLQKVLSNSRNYDDHDRVAIAAPATITITPLGSGGNTGAALMRVRYTATSSSPDATAPSSLILKMSDTSKMTHSPANRSRMTERYLMVSSGYSDAIMLERELDYYTHLASPMEKLAGVTSPRVYYTDKRGSRTLSSAMRLVVFGKFQSLQGVILMEDLGEDGVTFDATSEEIGSSTLDRMLEMAARFVGGSGRLIKQRGKIPSSTLRATSFQYPLTMFDSSLLRRVVRSKWHPGISEELAKTHGVEGEAFGLPVLKQANVMAALKAFESVVASRGFPPRRTPFPFACFLHGDLHAGNFMLKRSGQSRHQGEGELKIFDMQMWGLGHPAVELAYFLASNAIPDFDSDDRLMTNYYETVFNTFGVGGSDDHDDDQKAAAEEMRRTYPLETFKIDTMRAGLQFMAAAMVRRWSFDTPSAIRSQIERAGERAREIQSVLSRRESRFIRRCAIIFEKRGGFDFLY